MFEQGSAVDELTYQLNYCSNFVQNAFGEKRGKEEILTSWRGAEQCGMGAEIQLRKQLGGEVVEPGH